MTKKKTLNENTNFDSIYFNSSDADINNYNKNNPIIRESLISNNYSLSGSNKKNQLVKFSRSNSLPNIWQNNIISNEKDNFYKENYLIADYIQDKNNLSYLNKFDQSKNYNFRYNLNNQNEFPNNVLKAYLKKDFYLESLKLEFKKNEKIDIIFMNSSNNVSSLNSKGNASRYNSNCFLIFEGNYHPISRENIEIYRD